MRVHEFGSHFNEICRDFMNFDDFDSTIDVCLRFVVKNVASLGQNVQFVD